jgi:hypothetical protein
MKTPENNDPTYLQHTPVDLAMAVFRGGKVYGTGKEEAGLTSRQKISLGCVEVCGILKAYNMVVTCSGASWPADTFGMVNQNSYVAANTMRFFCADCKKAKKMTLVAVGTCREDHVEMRQLYPHHCEDNISVPFINNKYIVVDFDFEKVVGNTYQPVVEKVRDMKYNGPLVGDHINFGIERNKYDDRMYQDLPWLSDPEQHKLCMIRLQVHVSVSLNITKETTAYSFDVETVRGGGKWKNYPWKKNEDCHLSVCEPTAIYGGHSMPAAHGKLFHQPRHTDGNTSQGEPMANNPALAGKTKPGSIIVPLVDYRCIYMETPSNIITVNKGQYIVFFGDTEHGGVTYHHDGTNLDWHLALHIHFDSTHHPRVSGDVVLIPSQSEDPPTDQFGLTEDLGPHIAHSADRMKKLTEECGRRKGKERKALLNQLHKANQDLSQALAMLSKDGNKGSKRKRP